MILCGVCGEPATVHVIIECADGDIIGPLCGDHADDIEPYVGRREPIAAAPSEEQPLRPTNKENTRNGRPSSRGAEHNG